MSLITDLVERLRTLVFRRQEERELEEELRFHVTMEAEQLQHQSGVSATEAHRRSVMALGGIEQTKEDVRDARGTRLFEDTGSDIKRALRSLRKSPGFATVAILTLAIGIGATTAVYSAVDAVLLRPLPYQQPEQLVRLYQYFVSAPANNYVSPVHVLDYRTALPSLEAVAAIDNYHAASGDIGGSDHPERIRLLPVSSDYWNVLRAPPMLGHGISRDEENRAAVVVLSYGLWKKEFQGRADAIGQPLLISGRSYSVIGVMPEAFADPMVKGVDAWVAMDMTPARDISNANNHYVDVIARMRAGTTIKSAQAELDKLSLQLATKYGGGASDIRARLEPLKQDIVAPASHALSLMLGAVIMVLLLVCVNIANLLLVRGSERAREFALRTALGAQRARLVRQLLVESLTLAIAGALGGLLIARLTMIALVRMANGAIPRLTTLALEPRLLLFAIGVASLSAIVFGLAPALRATRVQPSDVLRAAARSSTGSRAQGRVREGLVMSQVALAFVLLIGATLLIASFQKLQHVDLGVRPAKVLTFELQLPSARYDSVARASFYETFAQKLMATPGVVAAGGISRLPATGEYNVWGTRPTTGPKASTFRDIQLPTPQQRVVSGEYFRAVGIRVLEGRTFNSGDDRSAPARAVISQQIAEKYFPGVDAVGQRIATADGEHEIIGVVNDVAVNAEGTLAPILYHAHTQFAGDRNWELSQVIATTGNPDAMIPAARRVLASLDPQLVMYKPTPLADVIGFGVATRVFTLRVLTAFAAIALLLAALGLYGVLSYTVKLRTREFGIRMALGANRNTIRNMVIKRGLLVASVGIAIGLLAAFGLSRVMASMVFGISALDPRVLAGATIFMAFIAVGAAYFPAYRATTVDPRQALAGE